MATLNVILQREALKLVTWQLVLALIVTGLISLCFGLHNGYSTLLGAGAYLAPNFLFAWSVFSYAGARLAEKFMVAFFLGEASKLIISAILFILITKYIPVNVVFVLTGYIVAIVSFWFVCGWHFGRSKA